MKKLLVSLALLAPSVAFAQLPDAPNPLTSPGEEPVFVTQFLGVVANWIFSILLTVGVIMMLLAAWKYLMSEGSSEKTEEAKKAILYGLVAIAIAVLARGIVAVAARIAGQPADKLTI